VISDDGVSEGPQLAFSCPITHDYPRSPPITSDDLPNDVRSVADTSDSSQTPTIMRRFCPRFSQICDVRRSSPTISVRTETFATRLRTPPITSDYPRHRRPSADRLPTSVRLYLRFSIISPKNPVGGESYTIFGQWQPPFRKDYFGLHCL
jgi:hypothetical protein